MAGLIVRSDGSNWPPVDADHELQTIIGYPGAILTPAAARAGPE